jgi:hypothetical protein
MWRLTMKSNKQKRAIRPIDEKYMLVKKASRTTQGSHGYYQEWNDKYSHGYKGQ